MKERIQVRIEGAVFGFQDEQESLEEAESRLVFNTEQKVNESGEIRAHFGIGEKKYVGIHHHRHGTSVYPLLYNNLKEFVEEIGEDFEEDKEEWVEILGPFKWGE